MEIKEKVVKTWQKAIRKEEVATMRITKAWIEKWEPCQEAVDWVYATGKGERDAIKILKLLISNNKLDWANWMIVRLMSREQRLRYACYTAKLVLPIFEQAYPDDKRPREAITAARRCIKNDTRENREKAAKAADAAYAACTAACAACGDDAEALSYAAYYAANAAYYAAYYAAKAVDAADAITLEKILAYGLRLLREGKP